MTDIADRRADPARLPRPGRGGGGRRVGPDPEPGDARRQHLQRVAGGRHGAGAARLRGAGRRRRAGRRPGRSRSTTCFVRSGVTTLARGELVTAIELPRPDAVRRGAVHVRRTRRRGHDLASVTLACAVGADGVTRIAYGSLGPRPVLVVDETGRPRRPGRVRRGQDGACSRRCSSTPARRRGRCGRAPSTGSRCSGSSACARSPIAIERLAERRRGGRRRRPTRRSTLTVNGRARSARGRSPSHAARGPSRRSRADRHEGVLPRRRVRRVHGARRRPERRRLPGAGRRGGRLGRDDRRGPGRRATELHPLQAAFLDDRRRPVRVLHPGPADLGAALLARHAAPDARRDRGGAGREPVPLRRVRADLRGGRARRGRTCGADDERHASAESPARVGGLDRVTGRQAYVADIRLERTLHAKLVTRRLRAGADPSHRHERGARRAGRPLRDRRPPTCPSRSRGSGRSSGTGRSSPSTRRTTTANRSPRSRPRRSTPPRRPRASSGSTSSRSRRSSRSPTRWRRTRRSCRTRRSARAIRSRRRTSSASTTTAGATWTRRAPQADVVVEGTYRFPMVTQFAIEPHAFIAAPDGDGIAVWSSIQHPNWLQRVVAGVLGMPLVEGAHLRARPGRRVRRQAARQVRAARRVHGAPGRPAGPPRPDARGDVPGRPPRRVGDPRPDRLPDRRHAGLPRRRGELPHRRLRGHRGPDGRQGQLHVAAART